jgi:hypothetical protein
VNSMSHQPQYVPFTPPPPARPHATAASSRHRRRRRGRRRRVDSFLFPFPRNSTPRSRRSPPSDWDCGCAVRIIAAFGTTSRRRRRPGRTTLSIATRTRPLAFPDWTNASTAVADAMTSRVVVQIVVHMGGRLQ